MLTLEQDAREFETNANQTGLHQFLMLKRGVTPLGKNVYIYQRAHAEEGPDLGRVVGYEVIIPNIKKAGVYNLPLPKGAPKGTPKPTITYAEDFEEYPGASLFGKRAWYCSDLEGAEKRFALLTAVPVALEEGGDEPEPDEPAEPKPRGRAKIERAPLNLPEGEFSVKEVAEKNGVEYVVAFQIIKEKVAAGLLYPTRTERRAARGKVTQLYARVKLTTTNILPG